MEPETTWSAPLSHHKTAVAPSQMLQSDFCEHNWCLFCVSDLMRKDSHSCGTDLPLPKAASQLHERGTQRLFVLDGNQRPVGVITRGDVVRALASHNAG